MSERTIIVNDDGSSYSPHIAVFSQNENGRSVSFLCEGEHMYSLIRPMIGRLLSEKDDPDAPQERKRLARLIKTGIKGMLLMSGDNLLTMLFGTKDHPKPQKGDDLLSWYGDMFARIAIAYLMKNDTYVYGEIVTEDNENTTVQVYQLATRPVTTQQKGDVSTTSTKYDPSAAASA